MHFFINHDLVIITVLMKGGENIMAKNCLHMQAYSEFEYFNESYIITD